MEHSLENLTSWFRKDGGYLHPAAEFAHRDDTGVYLRRKTHEKIRVGSVVISCPHHITLSALDAVNSHWKSAADHRISSNLRLPSDIVQKAPRPQTLAALYLCVQRSLGQYSFWSPYINLLPKPIPLDQHALQDGPDLPLWWDSTQLSWADGSPLSKGWQDLQAMWRGEYETYSAVFHDWCKANDIDASWTAFKWALSILTSRAFQSSLMNQATTIINNETKRTLDIYDPDSLLYPTLDLLNHSPHTKNRWITDAERFSIICEDELGPGDEIFNFYGTKNNGQLLLSYGFALEHNPHEAFPLRLPPQEYPCLEQLILPAAARRDDEVVPSRTVESHVTSALTFYVRRTLPDDLPSGIPEYVAPVWHSSALACMTDITKALSGMPHALIAYLTSLLMNTQEKATVSTWPSQRGWTKPLDRIVGPVCVAVSVRISLAIASLLLDRLRVERSRLDASVTNLSTTNPMTAQSRQRHTNASIYMRSTVALLDNNISALETGLTESLSELCYGTTKDPTPPYILPLSKTYLCLDGNKAAAWNWTMRHLTSGKASDRVDELLQHVREKEVEEDALTLCLGLVMIAHPPVLICATSLHEQLHMWMKSLFAFFDASIEPYEVDQETVSHVEGVIRKAQKAVEGQHRVVKELWEDERWKDEAFVRMLVRVVDEYTVGLTMSKEARKNAGFDEGGDGNERVLCLVIDKTE